MEEPTPFTATLRFAQAWALPQEAGDDGVTEAEARAAWTAAGCDGLPPALAFLAGLAALRLGADPAARLMGLAAEAAREAASDGGDGVAMGLGRGPGRPGVWAAPDPPPGRAGGGGRGGR
ncbi:MAG: hypothetical protein ACK4WC_16895, partial [Rubrimonas sp.]